MTAAAPQSPTQAVSALAPVTITQIVLMVLLALAAIGILWWGTVLRRRRRRAARQVEENFRVAEAHGATCDPPTRLADEETATVSADVPRTAGEPVAADQELTRIKGLGPKAATLLAGQGIARIADLAALDSASEAALDAKLGDFRGRMARDRWVEQARLLARGDVAGYEAAFGKLG